MTDAFEELGLPRRAGLAGSDIKASFLERAKSLHPDNQTGDSKKFESLRVAYDLLRDPATRLRHLITLETGLPPNSSPPTGHFELFSSVCQVAEQTRIYLSEVSRASSPLARSLAAVALSKSHKAASDIAAQIADIEQSLTSQLAGLDAEWPQHEVAAALASEFAFIAKCRHQISECLFELNASLRGIRDENRPRKSGESDLSDPAKTNTHHA